MKKIISNHKKRFAVIVLLIGMLAGAMMPLQRVYAQGTVFRVFFHICRNDNGTNAAVTEAQVQSAFNQLQTDFAPGNICFINMGVDYISNTDLNYYDGSWGDYMMLYQYEAISCINIFYNYDIDTSDNKPRLNFTYFNSNIENIVVKGLYIDTAQTTSYAIALLLKSYSTWAYNLGFEDINGSNSTTAGDGVADTPADPWAYYVAGSSCFSTFNGSYSGSCTDGNGQSNFNPPYFNLMANWWSLGWAPLILTPGQFAKINDFIITGAVAPKQSPANTTIAPGNYGGGYELRSAIDVLNTSGTVHMYGNYKTTNIGGTVLLEPGFRANPSAGGLVIFKGHTCGYVTPRVASETNSVINANTENSLKCYPNPFSGNLIVEFNLSKEDVASIKLYNMMGKEMKAISKSFYALGKHQITIDATDLAAGIYFVVLQSSDFKQEQKIVKVK